MTVQKLLAVCWTYEWISVEDLNGEPVCEPEEAVSLFEKHPETADLRVHVFFVGTRFVKALKKSIPVLVVEVE